MRIELAIWGDFKVVWLLGPCGALRPLGERCRTVAGTLGPALQFHVLSCRWPRTRLVQKLLGPLSQHSLIQSTESRGAGSQKLCAPSCASAQWPKGRLLWEEQGASPPPHASPCTLPYLSPPARNLLCSANFLQLSATSLMGGGEGTRPHLLHFFYLGTVPDKITSVYWFFTAGIPDCFLSHTVLSAHMAEISGLPLEQENSGAAFTAQSQPKVPTL